MSHIAKGEDRPVWPTRVFKAVSSRPAQGDGKPSMRGIHVSFFFLWRRELTLQEVLDSVFADTLVVRGLFEFVDGR